MWVALSIRVPFWARIFNGAVPICSLLLMMVPIGVLIIKGPLVFRVPKKGTVKLRTDHIGDPKNHYIP